MKVPVMVLKSSPARWIEVPLPPEAMLSLPGLPIAYFTKSATLLMLSAFAFSAFISITFGTAATSVSKGSTHTHQKPVW